MKKMFPMAAVAIPGPALAHPGHGVVTNPILHQLVEPAHLLPVLAVLATASAIVWYRRQRNK